MFNAIVVVMIASLILMAVAVLWFQWEKAKIRLLQLQARLSELDELKRQSNSPNGAPPVVAAVRKMTHAERNRARAEAMTPERRKEIARLGGIARWQGKTPEERQAHARYMQNQWASKRRAPPSGKDLT